MMDKLKQTTNHDVTPEQGQSSGWQHYLNALIDRKVAVAARKWYGRITVAITVTVY